MDTIRVLIVGGRNNHDWRRSSPFCKQVLEASGRFQVDITETPNTTLGNLEALKAYQVILLDYNGNPWQLEARANFVTAVRDWGTGVFVLHAANNAFPGWKEYEEICGLLWRQGTGHGDFHEFPVTIKAKDHPITRGLSDYRTWDELYHRLVNPRGVPCEVLATGFSTKESKGTGQDEPVMIALTYGKARIFHQILGHVWAGDPNGAYRGASMVALDNPTFRTTLLRGCEWAATGSVTL